MKLFSLIILTLIVSTSVCGQKKLRELTGDTEASANFEFLAKPGVTKKYLVNPADIPNAPRVPNAYQAIEGRSYYLKTDAVYLGDIVFKIKVPINNEADFKKVKIFQLVEDDFDPSGLGWRDCTITREEWADPKPERTVSAETKERMLKFVPNYRERSVSCVSEFRYENYFIATLQSQNPPEKAFTDFKVSLDPTNQPEKSGPVTYVLSFKNMGNKAIQEINVRSDLDVDTKVLSIKPSQGLCRKAKRGSSFGSQVCHLGMLAPGAAATIELIAGKSGMTGGEPADIPNQGWMVRGFIKESANDPNWPANWFSIEPLNK